MARVKVMAGLLAALACAAGTARADGPSATLFVVPEPAASSPRHERPSLRIPGSLSFGSFACPPVAVIVTPQGSELVWPYGAPYFPPANAWAPRVITSNLPPLPPMRAPDPPPTYSNPSARYTRSARRTADAQAADRGPDPVREVVASGSAAVRDGDVLAARGAAIQQALRNALEEVAGVYISSSTVAENFVALRDRVSTHSEGYVVPGPVLQESATADEYKVRMKATVSLRPLLAMLRELGLTRQWRVAVALRPGREGTSAAAAATAQAEVISRLRKAGFEVVELPAGNGAETLLQAQHNGAPVADVLIAGTADAWLALRLPTTVGTQVISTSPVYQARVDARATRVETGEILSSHAISELIADSTDAMASRGAVEEAAGRAASAFVEDIMALPAGSTRHIRLEIRGFATRTQAQQFQDQLAALPSVRGASVEGYNDGTLSLELEVDSRDAERLGSELETALGLAPFNVVVETDTKAQIHARVAPAGKSGPA